MNHTQHKAFRPRTLSAELWELVRAGFSGIWIETHEPSEALLELFAMGAEHQLQILSWNLDTGLRAPGNDEIDAASDPLSAVRSLGMVEAEEPALLILENFHRFVDSAEVCQALLTQLLLGKQQGRHVVVLSPVTKLPAELERQFVVLRHPLPNRTQISELATSLSEESMSDMDEAEAAQLLDAAMGLTASEAESALSLSLVRHGRFSQEEIWQLKSRWLNRSGMLQLHRGEQGFDSIGGLLNLKQFCARSLAKRNASASPRGVMLLGVPGTGKSAFAKSLGKETGRPVLMLDVGQVMGSLVGQSESNIRKVLETAEAMAPCILFIDEVEKALAGVASGGRGDSGVSARIFGTLLTWLNDHSSDVYVVVTCNNIQQLPPEFSRAERFDAIMFLDLPDEEEKRAIWSMYLSQFELEADQPRPTDEVWTGAEIKACCRLASLLQQPLTQAALYVVPVGVTAAEEVQKLRAWANGRCLNASEPGIYRAPDSVARNTHSRKRRGVSMRPSVN